MSKNSFEEENTIGLYKGSVRYYRGIWATDAQGKSYVALDDSSKDSWEYSFDNAPATSVNQLIQYVLPSRIQEENKLVFPAYINWEEGLGNLVKIGSIPTASKRFENLVTSIDVRGEK